MWLQMLKVAVIIRMVTAKCWKLLSNLPKLQSRDCIFFKIAVIFLKFNIIFVNFAVNFWILQSNFKSCSHVIADFEKLQSHFDSCSHGIADFKIWLQNVESCSHISNFDCNFQHFAVTFRVVIAIFNILRSHFELWLQNVEIYSHIWEFWNYQHRISQRQHFQTR